MVDYLGRGKDIDSLWYAVENYARRAISYLLHRLFMHWYQPSYYKYIRFISSIKIEWNSLNRFLYRGRNDQNCRFEHMVFKDKMAGILVNLCRKFLFSAEVVRTRRVLKLKAISRHNLIERSYIAYSSLSKDCYVVISILHSMFCLILCYLHVNSFYMHIIVYAYIHIIKKYIFSF